MEPDHLECNTCNYQFDLSSRKPLILDCGHIHCEECVRKLISDRN